MISIMHPTQGDPMPTPAAENDGGSHVWAIIPGLIGLCSAAIGLVKGRRGGGGGDLIGRLKELEDRVGMLETALFKQVEAANGDREDSREFRKEIRELLKARPSES